MAGRSGIWNVTSCSTPASTWRRNWSIPVRCWTPPGRPWSETARMPLPGTAVTELRQSFGDRFQQGRAIRDQHAATTTWIAPEPPDAVVFARSTEEVATVVRLCGREGSPVIPFGAGTSLVGQVNAPRGGISLDLSQMNRILALHAEDMDAVV